MNNLSPNKQPPRLLDILSLPQIKKKPITLSAVHITNSKIKIDLKRPQPQRYSNHSPLFESSSKKKTDIINLEELDKRGSLDALIRQ